MAEATTKLKLPLLQGSDLVAKNKINDIVESIDEKCLSVTHVESKQHWSMWEADKQYGLKDVVRTSTSPTWGFLECTQPGISNVAEPTGLVGEGDTKIDGTAAWILRRLGSIAKHGDLSGRQLADQHPISAIAELQEELDDKEKLKNKGQPSGYASLDAGGRIPITQLPSNIKEMRVVADIGVRNSLVAPNLYDGLRVWVLDATGDNTVKSGWAEYVYDETVPIWIKISEKESMDVIIDFNNITNVPDVLSKLSDSGGALRYGNSLVYTDIRSVKFIGGESEMIYDWAGTVKTVKINCSEVRTESLVFSVQVQTKDHYIAKLNLWLNVGEAMSLPAGEVYKEFAITTGATTIGSGDVIRASTVGDDTGVTFTVIIQNN